MGLLTRRFSTSILEPSAVCVEMFLYYYNKPLHINNVKVFLLFSVIFEICFTIVEYFFHFFPASTYKFR